MLGGREGLCRTAVESRIHRITHNSPGGQKSVWTAGGKQHTEWLQPIGTAEARREKAASKGANSSF